MMSLTHKSRLKPPKVSLLWSKAKRKEESDLSLSHTARPTTEKNKTSTSNKERNQGIFADSSSSKRCLASMHCLTQPVSREPMISAASLQHDGKGSEQWPSPSHSQAEEDVDSALVIPLDEEQHEAQRAARKKVGVKRKRDVDVAEGSTTVKCGSDEEDPVEVEIDRDLDRELETKSRQHNLTTMNVRNIIHEVITNEHVVAMMKAAITDTEPMPTFEPKMTRSKLKEVVEKGVVIPAWSMSPIKKPSKIKPPQFVDIPLEEEDSSDEEYRPNEDEEDETAEETLLESDMESTASSPQGSRAGPPRIPMEYDEDRSYSPTQRECKSRHLQVEVVPMGPPPPPQLVDSLRCPKTPPECSFMEKLHAVEEELAISPICMDPYQVPFLKNLSGGGHENSLMACRTRSKRPLRDVPLGQLEAELRAPDITPDMYECVSAPEDKEWAQWLQGLMASDVENEEDGDDDDDPEYNFLEDIDEPDLEDYRNDRAVRISKKEVNELMEELFETFHDELGVQEQDEEAQEEDEEKQKEIPAEPPKVSVPQTVRFDEPLPYVLTEHRRTVREQLAALRQYQARLGNKVRVSPVRCLSPPRTLSLTPLQKQQLRHQIQQHTQLLTQVHMLSHTVEALQKEANLTQQFLTELQIFAQRGEETRGKTEPGFISVFRACNLHGAMSLLDELRAPSSPHGAVFSESTQPKAARSYPLLPPGLAWLLATRPVFLYPELLPHCSLDPALHPPRASTIYTQGENSLLVLGLRNFRETVNPYQLISQYLLCTKSPKQLRRHVKDMCHRQTLDNIIKFYCQNNSVPSMPVACGRVMPEEQCPPVEREKAILPSWLRKSLPFIHEEVQKYNSPSDLVSPTAAQSTSSYTFPHGSRYPRSLPENLTMRAAGFRRLRPLPVSMQPVSNPPSLGPRSSENLQKDPQVASTGHTTLIRVGRQRMREKTQQIPTRKLCHIQPAPPKLPSVGLQLFTVVPGGVMNMLNLGGEATARSISVDMGKVRTGMDPAGQCSPASPIIMSLVPALPTSVIFPTPADSGVSRSSVELAWKSVTHPTDVQPHGLATPLMPATSAGPSQHVPASDRVGATKCELISHTPLALKSTISMNNGTNNSDVSSPKSKSAEDHPFPKNKFHFTCLYPPVQGISTDISTTSEHIHTRDEVVAVCPTLSTSLDQTEALHMPSFSADCKEDSQYATTSCCMSQNCLILEVDSSNGAAQTATPDIAMSQLEQPQNYSELKDMEEPQTNPSKPKHSGMTETTLADIGAVSQAGNSSGPPSTNPLVHFENEVCVEDICQAEEEEYCNYGGKLLTLSESSTNQTSNLDSSADTFEIFIDTKEKTDGQNKVQQGKYRQVKGVGMDSNKVLTLLKWRSKYTGMTLEMNTMGKAQRRLESKREDDEGTMTDCKETEKREHYAQTKGDKQQMNDRQEHLFEFISKHDEEMSSSSEKSVPELQETMEKLSWLASERRLYEEGDAEKDDASSSFSSTSTSYEFSTPVSQNAQVDEKGMYEDEEAASKEGEMSHLAGKSRDHMLNSNLQEEKEDSVSAQSNLNSSSRKMKSHCDVFHTSSNPPSDTHAGERKEDQENAVTESRDLKNHAKHTKQWEWNDPQWGNLQSEELEDRQSKEQTRKIQKNKETGGSVPNHQSPHPSRIICAKNMSLTPGGEKVILWTRETDRAILTACQAQGATKNTFQAVSAQLGNKSAIEVAKRFQDLIRLFHAAAQRTHPESHISGSSAANKPD